MAEFKLNDKIEFAYASNSILGELLTELEKRFLYQKVLVIDNKYQLSAEIEVLSKNAKCNFVVVKNLSEYPNLLDVACVIDVNCNDLYNVKTECANYKKPYVLLLTEIVESGFLNSQIVVKDKIVNCNYPLGVVLLYTKVLNVHDFVCKFLLEQTCYMFDVMQFKIDNLFFNKKNNRLQELLCLNSNNICDIKNIKKIAKTYLNISLQKAAQPLSLLDRISCIACDVAFSGYYKIHMRFVLQHILTLIITDFFNLYTKKIKSTINIQQHQLRLQKYGFSSNFNLSLPAEQKIDFLLGQFKHKLLGYCKQQMAIINNCKNTIADINVDFLYKVYTQKQTGLSDFICIEPSLFNKNSILKIMSANGLLNFDF